MDYTLLDATGEISSLLSAADPYFVDDVKLYPEIVSANVPEGGSFLEGQPPFLGWYDGQWHQRPDRPRPFMTWDALKKVWADVRTLDQAKSERWESIQTARDAQIFGEFTWDSSVFQADPTSQQRIAGAVQLATLAKAANQPYSVDWTLADNSVRTLSIDDVIGVGLALGSMVQGTFAKGQALRAQIEAATTLDQVDAIVWS